MLCLLCSRDVGRCGAQCQLFHESGAGHVVQVFVSSKVVLPSDARAMASANKSWIVVSGFDLWRQRYIVAQRAGRGELGTRQSIYVGRNFATCFLTVLVGCRDGRSACQDKSSMPWIKTTYRIDLLCTRFHETAAGASRPPSTWGADPAGARTRAQGWTSTLVLVAMVLPVEVRCYLSCFRCLVRNARCNTMTHLTADAVCCARLARSAWCNTMSHLTAAGCISLPIT